jgi:hypothetical protein
MKNNLVCCISRFVICALTGLSCLLLGTSTLVAQGKDSRADSSLLVDDLALISGSNVSKTPITVGEPITLNEFNSFLATFNHSWIHLSPALVYPRHSTLAAIRELPQFVQQELFEAYRGSGNWNPLIPGTGGMSAHLKVLDTESTIGTNPKKIGPSTWTTTRYVIVSTVGILEDKHSGSQWRSDEIARLVEGSRSQELQRLGRVLRKTVGQMKHTTSNQLVTAILYVAIVDLKSRSVLKSGVGISSVTYDEINTTRVPGLHTVDVKHTGMGRLAHALVLDALQDGGARIP